MMIFNSIDQLSKHISILPRNYVIGITSGRFDIIHPLHVDYLNKCKRQCHILIVLLDTDRLCFENRKTPVTFTEIDRAYLLDNEKPVDMVCLIDDIEEYRICMHSLTSLLKNGNKDSVKLFKNSHEIYGKPVISGDGIELIIIPDVNRFTSSTEIKDFLKK